MLIKIDNTKWDISEKSMVEVKDDKVIFKNNTSDKITIKYKEKILIEKDSDSNKAEIIIKGKVDNSGGYLTFNDVHKVPINSESVLPIKPPVAFEFSITIAPNSKITLTDFIFDTKTERNLMDELDSKIDILVVVPDYPSYVNLYACAFAHSRNKEYVKKGLNIQVFAVNRGIWFQTKYERNNVPVIRGSYQDLKKLLSQNHYPVIITHFVDEYLYPIYEGNVYDNQQLLFICHGPETVYKYLVNKTRPYFTEPVDEKVIETWFKDKDFYVKRFAEKDNVEWIFVSDWLKEFSEEQQKIKFKHSRVINNIIDEELFPYTKRTEEDRKKILIVRKFDNICQHSIDQLVYCILELSRRDFFNDLQFDIYGDGNFFEELIEPIKEFENVHITRKFIPNEKLNEIYSKHGIMMLPSRHDAHAVSMGESASTGLVVLGSTVTSNPYFMNQEENHTLTDPEDFIALADVIERLYKNPKEFLRISENMSKFTRQFSKKNTVNKEIELIKESIKNVKKKNEFTPVKKENPILTIGVPAYNVEKYIEKTLISILRCKNAGLIEILVINDGSKDNTAKIVSRFEKKSNGIVRLINKENGGHGSTINRAIKEAKGKYFRLVDGDDWVDSENLDKLIEIMKINNNDIILTTGSYDYIEQSKFENIISYNNLVEGAVYNFEDLTYPYYGFTKYGPLLTTGNYKTELLRESGFQISEKKPYVDMEFNAFSIRLAKTITYYNLNIYRYLIGREGQTISRDFWKKKYKDHEYIIFNILKYISENEYSDKKRNYVLNNIIAPMVDSQVFMFDAICKWEELDVFINQLKEHKEAYKKSIEFIDKTNGNSQLILKVYKKKVNSKSEKSIIIPGKCENINDYNALHGTSYGNSKMKQKVKRVIKGIMPYGVVRIIQNRRR